MKKVIALRPFADALTGGSFRAGDEVSGWDEARAEHYAQLGVVKVEEQPAPKETPATAPAETAPAVGPSETATPKGPTKKK